MTQTIAPGLVLAAAPLLDGVFEGALVLILDADADGAVGVVLNHFSRHDLDDALPGWGRVSSAPRRLFDGGPVSRQGAICLAVPSNDAEEPPGWHPVVGRVGLLHLETPIEIVDGAYRHLRIYAGYAGWGPGQLEDELARGAWYPVEMSVDEMFSHDPDDLWRTVMGRQGGELAWLVTYTSMPEWN